MPETNYVLTKNAVRGISSTHHRSRYAPQNLIPRHRHQWERAQWSKVESLIALSSPNGIAGWDANPFRLNNALCTVHNLSLDPADVTKGLLVQTGQLIRVYNLSPQRIRPNQFIHVSRDWLTGRWITVSQDAVAHTIYWKARKSFTQDDAFIEVNLLLWFSGNDPRPTSWPAEGSHLIRNPETSTGKRFFKGNVDFRGFATYSELIHIAGDFTGSYTAFQVECGTTGETAATQTLAATGTGDNSAAMIPVEQGSADFAAMIAASTGMVTIPIGETGLG